MTKDDPAVIAHHEMLQNVIARHADKSAQCKTWCITLIAALVTVSSSETIKLKPEFFYMILASFWWLDCFYLGMEKDVRDKHSDFVDKMNRGVLSPSELLSFHIKSEKDICVIDEKLKLFTRQLWLSIRGMVSLSTTPFYGVFAWGLHTILS